MGKTSRVQERKVAVEMRLSGATFKEIQTKTGHDRKYVTKWVQRWKETGCLDDVHRSGAPKKISSSLAKMVVNAIKKNNSSCRKVAQEMKNEPVKISKSFIHRFVKSKGIRNVSPKKTFPFSKS